MNLLVVDIGGTHVKVLASGETESRQFDSGPALLPKPMAFRTQKITEGWSYDVVSIGYPGPVLRNRPIAEPHNLGRGWVGFHFEGAFARPVKLINDPCDDRDAIADNGDCPQGDDTDTAF